MLSSLTQPTISRLFPKTRLSLHGPSTLPCPHTYTIYTNGLLSFFFNWSIADVWWCVSFRCIPQWFRYTHRHTHRFFPSLFHNGLLQNIEYSSCARYTVGSCCLSILYVAMCVPANPKLLFIPPLFSSPSGNHKLVFYVCESVSVL